MVLGIQPKETSACYQAFCQLRYIPNHVLILQAIIMTVDNGHVVLLHHFKTCLPLHHDDDRCLTSPLEVLYSFWAWHTHSHTSPCMLRLSLIISLGGKGEKTNHWISKGTFQTGSLVQGYHLIIKKICNPLRAQMLEAPEKNCGVREPMEEQDQQLQSTPRKAPSKPFSAIFTACPVHWFPYPSLHQHKIAAS